MQLEPRAIGAGGQQRRVHRAAGVDHQQVARVQKPRQITKDSVRHLVIPDG